MATHQQVKWFSGRELKPLSIPIDPWFESQWKIHLFSILSRINLLPRVLPLQILFHIIFVYFKMSFNTLNHYDFTMYDQSYSYMYTGQNFFHTIPNKHLCIIHIHVLSPRKQVGRLTYSDIPLQCSLTCRNHAVQRTASLVVCTLSSKLWQVLESHLLIEWQLLRHFHICPYQILIQIKGVV